MEQLVHLRLKSIYKAFKSTKGGGGASTPDDGSGGGAIGSDGIPPSSSSSSLHHGFNPNDHHTSSARSLRSKKKGDMSLYEEFLNANKVGIGHRKELSGGAGDVDDNDESASGSLKGDGREQFCYDLEQNYLAEKKRADDAAAELLAELEEEEEAKAQKKSKKKKKKGKGKSKQNQPNDDDEPEDKDVSKPGSKVNAESKPSGNINEDSSDEEDGFDQMLRIASGVQNVDLSGGQNEEEVAPVRGGQERANKSDDDDAAGEENDLVEKELEECIEAYDMDGIEDILNRLKGIPGRAVIRKNAKKALKRLKAELEPPAPEPELEPESVQNTAVTDTKASAPVSRGSGASSDKLDNQQSTTARSSYYTPRADTVVQIKSRLVGWMIGKGGQRIRDIMEESGAKIWIDQETAKGQEWRNVNISGDATSREIAVRLINDIVENAPPPPGATTKDEIEINYASSDIKGGEAAAWSSSTEKPAAVPAAGGSASATQTSSAAETAKAGTAFEILTCEPRFVALLIGKRGWTIKNIQDESGARVDINQNVTPRQIKISGTRASVDRAVGLVQDVLSYPHAQLHGVVNDSNEPVDIAAISAAPEQERSVNATTSEVEATSDDAEIELIAANAQAVQANEHSVQVAPDLDRNESPPPMVGDAKSAISASSSLSSTPEPSMASSAKGLIAAAAAQLSAPALPPTPEKYSLVQNESGPVALGSFQHPDVAFPDAGVVGRHPTTAATLGTSNQTMEMPHVSVQHHPPPPQGNLSFEAGAIKNVLPPGLGPHGQPAFYPQMDPSLSRDPLQALLRDPLQTGGSERDGSVGSASRPTMDFNGVNPQLRTGTSPTARRSTAGMTRAQIIASTPLSELMGNPGLSRASSSPVGGYERDDVRRSGSAHSRGYAPEGPSGYGREYERDGRRYVEGQPRSYDRDEVRRFSRSHSSEGGPPPEYRRGYDEDRAGRRSYHAGHPRSYGRYEEEDTRRSFQPGMGRPFGGRYEEERRSYNNGHPRAYDGRYEDAGRRSGSYHSRPPPASYDRGYDRGNDREYDRRYEGEAGGRRTPAMPAASQASFGAGPRSSGGAPAAFTGMRPTPHPPGEYGQEQYHRDSLGHMQQPHHPQHPSSRHSEPPLPSSHDDFNAQGMHPIDSQGYRGQHAPLQQEHHSTAGRPLFSATSAENLDSHKTDELGIIDSLFGGPSSTDDMKAATDSLLAGLTGLGLSGDTVKRSGDAGTNTGGLWGPSSLSDWGGNASGVHDDGMHAIGASLGDILGGTSTTPFSQQNTEHQHPSQNPPYGNQY
jgi:KH domain